MTISSTNRKAGPYIGNGTASVFSFSFKVFTAADVQVVKLTVATNVETVLALTTDYTVTLNQDQNANPGGSITLVAGALASGYDLVITSAIGNLQPTDLTNQGGFYPDVINDSLDRATIQIQQLQEGLSRAALLPITSAADSAALVADIVRLADSADNLDIDANNITSINTVAGSISNVNSVATNIASVNTTAGSIANVNTTAANIANVNAVGSDLLEPVSEINTVATSITNVNTVGDNIANVNTVAGNNSNVTTVAGSIANVNTVGGAIANVNVTAANIANVNAVGSDLLEPVSEINTVATDIANVNTVGANISNVNTVAGISGNVTTVAGISSNVTTVATNNANVTTVATNIANVNSVGGSISNVNTVATNIAAVNSAYTNLAAILDAPTQATNAANSAAAAAASAASGMYSAVQDKSANYTIVAADAGDLIRVTTTGGAVTITLPLIGSTGITDGFKIAIVKWTADANAVNIARSGSNTINGATSAQIGSQYSQIILVADAETSTWFASQSGLGATNINVDTFSGNGSTTGFTLTSDPSTKNNTTVFISGVYQQKSTYSLSGTTLTFSTAPPSGTSNIEVAYSTPLAIGTPSDGTVTAAKMAAGAAVGNIGYTPVNKAGDTMTGDLQIQQAAYASIRALTTDVAIDTRLQSYAAGSRGYVGTISNHEFTIVTNNTHRVYVDTSGRVKMPYQPVFMAYRSGGTVVGPAQVVFDSSPLNVGGSYNTSTGRFTAPISGNYLLAICLTNTSNANADANIKVNGTNYLYMSVAGTTGLYNQVFSQVFAVTLSQNDYVTVDVITGSISSNTQYMKSTSFSGFLIG